MKSKYEMENDVYSRVIELAEFKYLRNILTNVTEYDEERSKIRERISTLFKTISEIAVDEAIKNIKGDMK